MKHLIVAATLIVALATFASADDFRPIFHPPTSSILEALQQDPDNFSTLIGLLKKAEIDDFMLLAPTNAAFAKLSPEEFAKLTNDPKKLRQLLLAHLLPGKVLFRELFGLASYPADWTAAGSKKHADGTEAEPPKGRVANKNVTKSLKTANGGWVYIQNWTQDNDSTVNPASLVDVGGYHPLINKQGRVLKSDIEGTYAVIHVIDTVLTVPSLNKQVGSAGKK